MVSTENDQRPWLQSLYWALTSISVAGTRGHHTEPDTDLAQGSALFPRANEKLKVRLAEMFRSKPFLSRKQNCQFNKDKKYRNEKWQNTSKWIISIINGNILIHLSSIGTQWGITVWLLQVLIVLYRSSSAAGWDFPQSLLPMGPHGSTAKSFQGLWHVFHLCQYGSVGSQQEIGWKILQ